MIGKAALHVKSIFLRKSRCSCGEACGDIPGSWTLDKFAPWGNRRTAWGGGRYGKLESWSVGVVACGGKVAPPGATAWGGMHGRLESWSVGVVRTPEADTKSDTHNN